MQQQQSQLGPLGPSTQVAQPPSSAAVKDEGEESIESVLQDLFAHEPKKPKLEDIPGNIFEHKKNLFANSKLGNLQD